jgi:hypothetical protein
MATPNVPDIKETPLVTTKEETPLVTTKEETPENSILSDNPDSRMACNWDIKPTEEDGVVTARNMKTAETFNGAVSDFNKLLRS